MSRSGAAAMRGVESPGILHLDMDAFFASVEIRDDPALAGRPVVVGGSGARSVVAAASYAARRFGIRSAMPMASARRLCPDLVIVPPRIDTYRAVSREVMGVLRDVAAEIEQVSIDEAFIDVRPAQRLFGPPEQIAQLLRCRIREEIGLPSSVGGAVSRPVAKIASAQAKPDGMLIVPAERTAEFLAPLPVGAIAGVGPKAVERFVRLGVRTVGDLRDLPASVLMRVLGPRAEAIARLAAGEDRTGLGTSVRDHSVGTERTWEHDITEPVEVRRRITQMADDIALRLRREGFVARTVVLKLRAPDGTTITRSSGLGQPTASGERLREHVVALWEREADRMPRIRLAGVRAAQLERSDTTPAAQELSGDSTGWQGLEAAWDRARDRFGAGMITRGSSLTSRTGRADDRTAQSRNQERHEAPDRHENPDRGTGRRSAAERRSDQMDRGDESEHHGGNAPGLW